MATNGPTPWPQASQSRPPAPEDHSPGAGSAGPDDGSRPRRRWLTAVVGVAGLSIGAVAGVAIGSEDPTTSPEYEAVADERAALDGEVADLTARVETAEAQVAAHEARESELDTRESDLDARSAELDTRECALVTREEAVTATENKVAESQIHNGIWTVGVDIEPGTYRIAEAVTSMCYWAILKTGTNGDDIIANDLPDGGYPTVTLSAGQDFENDCGVWNQQ